MAQLDTGLGWSANRDYLIQNGPQYIGYMIKSDYAPNTNVFAAAPTIQDLISGGASFSSNGQTYHVGIYCERESYTGAIEIAVYNGNTNRIISFGFFGDTNFHLNYLRVCITDGTNIYTQNRNVSGNSEYNSDTGLYQDLYENIYISWGNFGTLTPGTAKTGANRQEVLDQFSPETFSIYKQDLGYAVCCFAKWITIEGNTLVSPVLISSVTAATVISYNGIVPADPQTTFDFLLDGIPFNMSLLPGYDADSVTAESSIVPVIDLSQFGASMPVKIFRLIASSSFANIQVTTSPDPYSEEGGVSGEEGGEGEETESDENGIEVHETYPSAIDTGFCRIYSPSKAQLQALSSYLWSNSYDLEMVKKLFTNPMDSILGLSAVPIRLSGSDVSFSIGGVVVPNMTLPLVTKQFYTYPMGAVTITERWGSYLDYEPYTKFSIVLPFIGIRDLSADDIMGKQLILFYDIDILSGACIARIQAGHECLYEFSGTCAVQLPVNSRNWDSVFNSAVSAVSGIVTAAAGGSAPLVAGSVASAALQTVSMKPRVEKSGNISGAAGWMGQLRPYIIRTTPEAYIPKDQNTFIGYPSYINVDLATLKGYNEVESIHLENIPATSDELNELETILRGGAIF